MLRSSTEATPLVRDAEQRDTTSYFKLLMILMPALLGNTLEFFDYACYSNLTTEIAKANFGDSAGGSEYFVWGAFSLGQAARPVGGAIFGALADRHGRKAVILWATIGMLVSTVLLGCIPTYRQCGETCKWAGFALILLLRTAQGLCAAGEVVIALTLAFEQAGPSRMGVGVAMVTISGSAGFLLATSGALLMETLTTEDQRLDWGWRVPFWMAVPVGVPILLLQRHMEESCEFRALADQAYHADKAALASERGKAVPLVQQPQQQQQARPSMGSLIGGVLRTQRLPFVVTWGVIAYHATWHYGMITYMKDELITRDILGTSEAGFAATLAMIATMCSELVFGFILDHSTLSRMIRIAAPVLFFAGWPTWVLITAPGINMAPYIGAVTAGALYGSHVVFIAITVAIFPTATRATALGLAYNFSQLCFGAPAPFLNQMFLDVLGQTGMQKWLVDSIAPSIWLYVAMIAGAATLCAAFQNDAMRRVLEGTEVMH